MGGTFKVLLSASCVMSLQALCLTVSRIPEECQLHCGSKSQRKLFLSWFRFQMYTNEVTLIL